MENNCANRECIVPANRRLTQPCLLNTGGMPDVIGSPCDGFVAPAETPCWRNRERRTIITTDNLCVCNRLPQLHEFNQKLCGLTIPPMMTIPVGDFITKNAELLALLPKETHNE